MANLSNTQITDKMLDAISVVSKRLIDLQPTDKTVQGTVVACVDQTVGKYKIKYQDGYWYAYSNNTDNKYSNGSEVYILIPGGDMSQDKIIVGSTKKLGINYINIEQDSEKYSLNGRSLIKSQSTNPFDIPISNDRTTYTLYNLNAGEDNNIHLISSTEIDSYVIPSKYLILDAWIQTDIEPAKRNKGNYGIQVLIDFIDNDDENKIVTRQYAFDIDNMIGQPYNFASKTHQTFAFEIDNINFKQIRSISLFCQNFDTNNSNLNFSNQANKIYFYDISLTAADMLTQAEKDGVKLELIAPKGYVINSISDVREIRAQVRVKMKAIDNDTQQLPFYWFKEDASITESHLCYNSYGGKGWRCLNQYNKKDGNSSYEFLPGSYLFTIQGSTIFSTQQKYKCVVVYDRIVLHKEFSIINTGDVNTISITSNLGTEFTSDRGRPTLTCKMTKELAGSKFYWTRTDAFGKTENLKNSTSNDNRYLNYTQKIIQLLKTKNSSITNNFDYNQNLASSQKDQLFNILKEKLPATNEEFSADSLSKFLLGTNKAAAKDLKEKFNTIESLLTYLTSVLQNKDMIVYGRYIRNIPVNKITNFNIYRCTVISTENNTENVLGTASITLTNRIASDRDYLLYIKNGDQVFTYNENGVAPTSSTLSSPMSIQALGFVFVDNNNQEVTHSPRYMSWKWRIPRYNTLLKLPATLTNPSISTDGNYYEITGSDQLAFDILNKYYVAKTNNRIQLEVTYKNNLKFKAETNFLFLKQGDPGTNGTEYTLRLKKGSLKDTDTKFTPAANQNNYLTYYILNTNSTFTISQLRPYLYRNEQEEAYSDTSSVKWQVLSYNNNKKIENKFYSCQSKNTKDAFVGTLSLSSSFSLPSKEDDLISVFFKNGYPENIIKCNLIHNSKNYYATMPILTSYSSDVNYRLRLKENTGFDKVVYKSDGTNPSYDNKNPFEIVLQKRDSVTNNWYDITKQVFENSPSEYSNDSYEKKENKESYSQNEKIDNYWRYSWDINDNQTAKIVWFSVGERINFLRKISDSAVDRPYKKFFKPGAEYQSTATNIGIIVLVKYKESENSVQRLFLHIPIHFLLNQYGNAALNGWDGNTVELGNVDSERPGVILAPQVGAGIKNSDDNTFTGIVMGTEKIDGGKNKAGETNVGLFGYANSKRSIFLNSNTGGAAFGIENDSQIIIDPVEGAKLKSGDYEWDPAKGVGMQINLSSKKVDPPDENKQGPWIRFGSQDFSVNYKGYLVAKGGGSIASWNISDTELKSQNNEQGKSVGMNSSVNIENANLGRKVRFSKMVYNAEEKKYDLIRDNHPVAFWANGKTNTTNNTAGNEKVFNIDYDNTSFFITHDGFLRASEAIIGSGTTKDTIYIGNGTNNVGTNKDPKFPSAIYSGTKSAKDANGSGFYLGTDGFAMGGIRTTDNGNRSSFQINTNGVFYAKEGYLGTGNSDDECWAIKGKAIRYKKTDLVSQEEGVYLGDRGIAIGPWYDTGEKDEEGETIHKPLFSVNANSGSLTAKKGYLGNWVIETNSIRTSNYPANRGFIGTGNLSSGTAMYFGQGGLRLGNGFHVSSSGQLYAISGEIGGCKVGTDGISSSNKSWSINKNGTATFDNVTISGENTTIGGSATITSGAYLSTIVNMVNSSGDIMKNTSLSTWIVDKIKANQLTANEIATMLETVSLTLKVGGISSTNGYNVVSYEGTKGTFGKTGDYFAGSASYATNCLTVNNRSVSGPYTFKDTSGKDRQVYVLT